jgi:hypothetical protein
MREFGWKSVTARWPEKRLIAGAIFRHAHEHLSRELYMWTSTSAEAVIDEVRPKPQFGLMVKRTGFVFTLLNSGEADFLNNCARYDAAFTAFAFHSTQHWPSVTEFAPFPGVPVFRTPALDYALLNHITTAGLAVMDTFHEREVPTVSVQWLNERLSFLLHGITLFIPRELIATVPVEYPSKPWNEIQSHLVQLPIMLRHRQFIVMRGPFLHE